MGSPYVAHRLPTKRVSSSVDRSWPLFMLTRYNICPLAGHEQLSGQELPTNFQMYYNICPWVVHGQPRLFYYIMGSSVGSSYLDIEKVADSWQFKHRFFIMHANNDYTIVDTLYHGKIVCDLYRRINKLGFLVETEIWICSIL